MLDNNKCRLGHTITPIHGAFYDNGAFTFYTREREREQLIHGANHYRLLLLLLFHFEPEIQGNGLGYALSGPCAPSTPNTPCTMQRVS